MPPSYIRVRAVVWAYGSGQTDTQTDRNMTRVTTIHFASSTTHAKFNEKGKSRRVLEGELLAVAVDDSSQSSQRTSYSLEVLRPRTVNAAFICTQRRRQAHTFSGGSGGGGGVWMGSDNPPPHRASPLYKTANCNAKLTNIVLFSSRLHHFRIIYRTSPASGDLFPRLPTAALVLDPMGTFIPSSKLSDDPPSKILDQPFDSCLRLQIWRRMFDSSAR